MLNRRILRIKAFKTIFSFAENPSMTLKEAESQLELSCESTRNLYLFFLASIEPVTREALARIEAGKSKFNPTDAERNPNMKFVENSVTRIFSEDPDFKKIVAKKKFDWEQNDVLLRHLYDSIKSSDWFDIYMESPERSKKEDAALWADIFEKVYQDNAEIEEILEDMSIWWNDDVDYALNWCCREMSHIAQGNRWNLPPLYMSDLKPGTDSDKAFVTSIVRKGVLNFEKYFDLVAGNAHKWERDRIVLSDLALIVAGMAEHEAFPQTDPRIIINEYVEITKFYSSPESRGFVNGLLDKLINNK